MSKITILFIAVCAILIQGKTAPALYFSPHHDISARDILDDAAKLLKQLQDVINTAVNSAINATDKLIDDCISITFSIKNEALSAIKTAIDQVLDQIKRIEEGAISKGIDVSSCLISEAEKKINQFADNALAEVQDCLTKEIQLAKIVIEDCQKIINATTFNILDDINKDIKNCRAKSIIEQAVCGAKVIAEITAQIAAVPLEVAKSVTNSTTSVIQIQLEMGQCTIGKVEKVTEQAAETLSEVTQCIKKLLS